MGFELTPERAQTVSDTLTPRQARYWDDLFWLVRTGIIEHLRREESK
jgi:hypothetical protein